LIPSVVPIQNKKKNDVNVSCYKKKEKERNKETERKKKQAKVETTLPSILTRELV